MKEQIKQSMGAVAFLNKFEQLGVMSVSQGGATMPGVAVLAEGVWCIVTDVRIETLMGGDGEGDCVLTIIAEEIQ